MIRRNLLVPEDTLGLSAKHLLISGAAKKLILKSDTLINDSMIIDENGLIDDDATE